MRSKTVRVPADVASNVPGSPDDNEDWRAVPCQRCNTQAMLRWRYCTFCGALLPTVLDGKVVKDTRKIRRSRTFLPADTQKSREQDRQAAAALTVLRKLHQRLVTDEGSYFSNCLFRARAVPGWIYDSKTDTVKADPCA
jgi:hypothetical protein